MYLTSSRPDIVQAVCYCARYQSEPAEKHLKEVKRIFRYLRGLDDRVAASFQLESDSTPHAHAQTTKTYYASRFKNQERSNIKTKTFANSNEQDLPSRYQVYQKRLLASFQDDAKYEHVGQETRSQGGKDDQD
nr:uncharacterized mitochondrial protein AtMg00810-like [Tanacetum cinerariifolium]